MGYTPKQFQSAFDQLSGLSVSILDSAGNQVIIYTPSGRVFQSYQSTICYVIDGKVLLSDEWNYSVTTSKYLSQFLGESTYSIRSKLRDGTYYYLPFSKNGKLDLRSFL